MFPVPQKWEIWLARVKFEEIEGEKGRPVLIYDKRVCYWISFKITSHKPRPKYSGEYQILNWEEAGLSRPSVIRCSKISYLQECDFICKLGRLHYADIREVQAILSQMCE